MAPGGTDLPLTASDLKNSGFYGPARATSICIEPGHVPSAAAVLPAAAISSTAMKFPKLPFSFPAIDALFKKGQDGPEPCHLACVTFGLSFFQYSTLLF